LKNQKKKKKKKRKESPLQLRELVIHEAGEIAQWLVVSPEDSGSVLSTHVIAHKH
jgi:NTP pyrophosphatase (non-canonical NTP hydrolase)